MKILFGVQGTGNGHISRAKDIIPALKKFAEVDILVSGYQSEINLPFPVKYKMRGLGFVFGKSGGIDFLSTLKKAETKKFIKEITSLKLKEYDVVISDFEPITAWAAKLEGIKCIGLSNQIGAVSPNAPKAKTIDILGSLVLNYYCPTSANYGFHYAAYDENIFTPIIRKEIREAAIANENYTTVYLPPFDDSKLLSFFGNFKQEKFIVFSKHNKKPIEFGNVEIVPINNERFIETLAKGKGVICSAGFQTTSEALFLGKKLLAIPMKNQYEQHCNAAALEALGVSIVKNLKEKSITKVAQWLENTKPVKLSYADETENLIAFILYKEMKNKEISYEDFKAMKGIEKLTLI